MKIARRTFTKSLGVAAAMLALPSWATKANAARLPIETLTQGASGPTYLRPDGSPTHW